MSDEVNFLHADKYLNFLHADKRQHFLKFGTNFLMNMFSLQKVSKQFFNNLLICQGRS